MKLNVCQVYLSRLRYVGFSGKKPSAKINCPRHPSGFDRSCAWLANWMPGCRRVRLWCRAQTQLQNACFTRPGKVRNKKDVVWQCVSRVGFPLRFQSKRLALSRDMLAMLQTDFDPTWCGGHAAGGSGSRSLRCALAVRNQPSGSLAFRFSRG